MGTVRAGEIGVDSSYSHPPTQRLVDQGYTFRVGYISVPPASPAKNITVAECVETIAAGQKLNLVWEMFSTRATLGGPFGTLDGLAAKQEAMARNQPFDVPIIFADDTGTTAANLPNKVAYMQNADAACKPYDIGIYGGVKILAALVGLWKIGWVPISAWSWSVSISHIPGETAADYNARGIAAATQAAHDIGAHVLQGHSFYLDNTWAIDPNEAIADFPAWGQPDPLEEDMSAITFEVTGLPGIYLWAPGMPAPIPFDNLADLGDIAAAMKAVACATPLTQEMYNRLVVPPITVPPIVVPPIVVPPATIQPGTKISGDLGASGKVSLVVV